MKKTLSVLLSAVILFSAMSVFASAENSVKVNVSISDANGNVVLAYKAVEVTDINNDSVVSIDDALYCAHEQYFKGGAAAGYASSASKYGRSLDMLWGDDTNGLSAFGYYINDTMALSLLDEVNSGDFISAYVYQDKTFWSDSYSYFDIKQASFVKGGNVTLTLTSMSFDPITWEPVPAPCANAVITIDGEPTEFKTDSQGKATISISAPGEYAISAVSDTSTLVPPVCIISVKFSSVDILNRLYDFFLLIKAFFARIGL